MFRRSLALTAVGLVVAGTVGTIPAQAAPVKIANGVVCPTLGKTAKANGYTYKCVVNTVVSKTKKTWTTTDCIIADSEYQKSNSAFKELDAAMPATLADLDTKIAEEVAKGVEAAAKADALQTQIIEWQGKIVVFTKQQASATTERDKLSAQTTKTSTTVGSIAKYNSAINSLTTAIRSLNSAVRGATAAQSSLRKVGKTAATMTTAKTTATQSLAQAKAGVTQALGMRALICQKGL